MLREIAPSAKEPATADNVSIVRGQGNVHIAPERAGTRRMISEDILCICDYTNSYSGFFC